MEIKWSYNDVHDCLRKSKLYKERRKWTLLGIPRSGLLVALIMATDLDLEVHSTNKPPLFKRSYLLVDDVIGSGFTMKEELKFLLEHYRIKPKTFSLIRDANRGTFEPDYCGIKSTDWIRLPWDEVDYAKGVKIKYNEKGRL